MRVNAICPGFITTDVTAGNFTPEQDRMILEAFPMGRAGIASAEIIILADPQPPVGHRAVAAPFFAEKDGACVLSVAYALLIGRLTHHDATPRLIGNALVTIGKTIRRTLVQLALRMVVNLPVGLHTPPVGTNLLISSSPLRPREWASLPLNARCCPSAWWLPWCLRSSPAFPQ